MNNPNRPDMTKAALLLTRPEPRSREVVAALKARGIGFSEIVISPQQRIVLGTTPPDLRGVAGLVFTSRHGVEAMAQFAQGRDLPVWCVGEATAAHARAAGWRAKAAEGTVEALYARISADAPRGPLLHLRGAHVRGDLTGALAKDGILLRQQIMYHQEACALSDAALALLARENSVIVPLFSPRSAGLFAREHRGGAPLICVAMSKAVAEAVAGIAPATLLVADKPDLQSMLDRVQMASMLACGIEDV